MADLGEYHPWLRDRLAALIQGDDKSYSTRGKIAQALTGSNGTSGPSFGLADFTPAGIPLNAYDMGRSAAQGQPVNAILSGLNLVPGAMIAKVPGLLKKGAQALTGGEDAAKIAAMDAPKSITSPLPALNEPTNPLAVPAMQSMSRRGFLGGVGAAGAAAALPKVAATAMEKAAPTIAPRIAAHVKAIEAHNAASTLHDSLTNDVMFQSKKLSNIQNFEARQHDALGASMTAAEYSNAATEITHPGYYGTKEDPEYMKTTSHEDAANDAESAAASAREESDPEALKEYHLDAAASHDSAIDAHIRELQKLGLTKENLADMIKPGSLEGAEHIQNLLDSAYHN